MANMARERSARGARLPLTGPAISRSRSRRPGRGVRAHGPPEKAARLKTARRRAGLSSPLASASLSTLSLCNHAILERFDSSSPREKHVRAAPVSRPRLPVARRRARRVLRSEAALRHSSLFMFR